MVRTKLLLPLWLYHHRSLYGLLEETADCWKRQHKKKTAHHTNKRYTAGLLFAQQFYLDADLVIIRRYRESTHPAGIIPQGILQTNTIF